MIDLDNLVNLQIMMFIIMGLGIVVRKLNIITPESRKSITNLFMNLILPCSIITSFCVEMDMSILVGSFKIIVIAFAVQFISLGLSKVLFLKIEPRKKVVLQYATICSNAGFMGSAIVEGIYGLTGLLYASIYLIPARLFMWSAGLALFTSTNRKDMIRNLLKHPCIIAVEIGFVLFITQYQLPIIISNTITSIGSCTTPLSMLVIGATLAEVDVKTIITKLTLYYTFIRLIFIPGLFLIIGYFLHIDILLLGITVVLSGMPAGSTTAILASQYDGDEQYASKIIFLSTLLSMFTIPIWCMILQKL